jgi:hypothetical protein
MTEDIIKNLPVLTEEEMKEISLIKEELTEKQFVSLMRRLIGLMKN